MTVNRRDFCKSSLTLAAAAGVASLVPGTLSCSNPNSKVVVGLIGCKGMGFSNLSRFMDQPDVEVAALCDVDENVLNKRALDVEKRMGKKPDLYKDFRKLLERKDIDAVIIGTPDHWHCLPFVYACEAGKDVYVEKPIANSIGECMIMAKAARKYNRVVQVGQWQRSGTHWQDAIDYVHSGKLGQIRTVKTWAVMSWLKPTPKQNTTVPAGVDYDFWLGPAPERPFNPNRFHFHFRWWWDYAGGLMTDWGVHLIDFALYGMNAARPNSIMATGGNFSIDKAAMETPDTMTTIYEYDNFMLQWEHAIGIDLGPYKRGHGVAFIGDNATLVVDRGGWEVMLEKAGKKAELVEVPRTKGDGKDHPKHVRDFLDCVKSRKTPKASIEIGKNVAMVAQMGNLAYRAQSKIHWDEKNFKFDNELANSLIYPNYRAPWSLPKL
ncbi:Gfo/Idh/MocA family oxidoreductase [Prolixibacteraceae bacterium JC049]|jgi:predicted dehydrogenase|nr:Gfo/Idh/MocA family oxidoreductase [Prolixibacteraceae bacterium JC049]